jgi:hypothetical protein
MITLMTKVQFKNFEPGEFVDVQARTYEETVRLIEEFPWNMERDKIVIDFTNPSVTIEGRNGAYLQLAVWYNQKYILRYIDDTRGLFTRSFINIKDIYDYIKYFFEQPEFDTADFKKETAWRNTHVKHFITGDFRYELTPKSIRSYLWVTSGMNFFFTVIIVFTFLITLSISQNVLMIFFLIVFIFVFGGGLNLILFFNYYKYAKDKILIMSKGNDIFYFGAFDSLIQFDKKDIVKYRTTKIRNSKNQFNGFAIVEIEFKNGTLLPIPNLLIGHSILEKKLFEYPRVEINKFPYLRL